MAKSKKSDSEKASKDKGLKTSKEKKSGKEKKMKKKDKPVEIKAEKKASVPKAEKKTSKAAKVVAPKIVFTTEEVSLRAYFIAERRQAMGWPGDSASDWAEAEKQLQAEARKKTKL
jgi:hypothetical protein